MELAITKADSNRIIFYADMQQPNSTGHGTIDEVEYSAVSNPNYVSSGTLNPKDIILRRAIKIKATGSIIDSMAGPSLGLVRIKFTYLDAFQQIISYNNANTYPDSIKYIKTEMWVESSDAVTDAFADTSRYSVTYWEFTINPRNL